MNTAGMMFKQFIMFIAEVKKGLVCYWMSYDYVILPRSHYEELLSFKQKTKATYDIVWIDEAVEMTKEQIKWLNKRIKK